eukprot:COSAG06_NODE_450_length_15622_cov_25.221671_1_plen_250_part_00
MLPELHSTIQSSTEPTYTWPGRAPTIGSLRSASHPLLFSLVPRSRRLSLARSRPEGHSASPQPAATATAAELSAPPGTPGPARASERRAPVAALPQKEEARARRSKCGLIAPRGGNSRLRFACSGSAPGAAAPLRDARLLFLVAGNRGRHGRTRGLTHDGQPAGTGTRIFAGVCAKSSAHMHPMSTLRELLHALGSQRERDGGNGGGAARCPCSLCCTVPLWALPRQRNQYPPGLLKQVIGSYSCESLR